MHRIGIIAGFAAIAVAGAAAAQQTSAADKAPPTADQGRILYVCDRSQATEKSFERQYGEIKFVTAREALSANRNHETWQAPRCIDGREYQRLMAMVAEQSQTIRLSAR